MRGQMPQMLWRHADGAKGREATRAGRVGHAPIAAGSRRLAACVAKNSSTCEREGANEVG
jgi:hypothetical protein